MRLKEVTRSPVLFLSQYDGITGSRGLISESEVPSASMRWK